jgi:uncharacterized membrane protein
LDDVGAGGVGGKWIGNVIWISLLFLFVWLLLAPRNGAEPRLTQERTRRESLDERLAKGEIDQTKSESRRKVLMQKS